MIDQTPACYLWTYDLFPPSSEQRVISLDEAQALVRHVWFFYRSGEIAPVVKLIEDDKHASGYRYALRLPKWAFTQSIVLHEIAHSLGFGDNGFVDEGFKGHGPLYMKTIIDLYAMFAGADRQHMLERAAHFGLVVDTD